MEYNIYIQNLKCGGCAHTIQTAIQKLKGVQNVEVDVEASLVTVKSDEHTTEASILAKLSSLGYPAFDEANPITKQAKSFISCAKGKILK